VGVCTGPDFQFSKKEKDQKTFSFFLSFPISIASNRSKPALRSLITIALKLGEKGLSKSKLKSP
jgi:hypothetical protein